MREDRVDDGEPVGSLLWPCVRKENPQKDSRLKTLDPDYR
jgi:hypothetical protein